jgi:hypothetical protein
MSDKNPSSKAKGPGAGAQGTVRKVLLCEEWEALLVDALDGKLTANDAAAFETHRESCLACAQLLEEAKRGAEWLHFLETEPEVPADLVGRILAQTSGAVEALPTPSAGFGIPVTPDGMVVAVPVGGGWVAGWLPRVERQAVQARWMMTAAMAFFSIAFTLNLTGVKLNSFRLADLRPTTLASTLTRQFYAADKGVMRYYDSLTFFYEVESRVREMKRIVEPVASPEPASPEPAAPAPAATNGSKSSNDDKAPAAKHTGGSAERLQTAPAPIAEPMGEPVIAGQRNADGRQQMGAEPVCFRIHRESKQNERRLQSKRGTSIRAERSLA